MNSKILKANYHTHTTFCDGNNSAEEMVIAAIERKFDILGFSGHSMFPFGELWHIAPKEHTEYVKTIRQLENKYKDKITILCGFEADFIPSFCEPSFSRFEQFQPDYLIGSVHYVANEKGFVTVDESPEGVKLGIDRLFNGNSKKFVQEYFYLERLMLTNGCFTILGHADLIRKRNGILNFFNEQDYLRLKDSYILDKAKMELARKDMIVLHPLPRVNEISPEVDSDPRAAYFKQVKYGMYAIWAVIPAIFKAFFKTNESLFTLMMNYIATQLVAFFTIVWEVPKGSGKIGIIKQDSNIGWLP